MSFAATCQPRGDPDLTNGGRPFGIIEHVARPSGSGARA